MLRMTLSLTETSHSLFGNAVPALLTSFYANYVQLWSS